MTETAAMAAEAPEQVNILVVDDLPEKHVVFRTVLDELGQNIVSARSGQEALKYILDMEFAVILLDVNMPDIDGLETAGLIRQYKKSAQTPIVFITAYVDDLQARRGYALGAVDYIPSPVVPEVLRSKVRVFCELFRMNRQLQKQAAQREALARSEAARQAAESAIHRADYLAQATARSWASRARTAGCAGWRCTRRRAPTRRRCSPRSCGPPRTARCATSSSSSGSTAAARPPCARSWWETRSRRPWRCSVRRSASIRPTSR